MSPPPRPPRWQEHLSSRLFRVLSPRLERREAAPPPPHLEPFERFWVPRAGGRLAATWYPARCEARGAVLLVHPWLEWGQAYFHRRGRLETLRRAGYHALTFDLSGIGASDRPAGFYDRDVEAALEALEGRAGGLPNHLWGVSSGGYWGHVVLSRQRSVSGAVFEDVSPHLLEWSSRTYPHWRLAFGTFRRLFPASYRYLDLRRHAPLLEVRRAAYVGGARDPGIPAAETRELAELAGARCLLVAEAGHLEAIKRAPRDVLALALATLEAAEEKSP